MSRLDDRVVALIEDRINDLERLFLTSEPERPTSQVDCCHDIVNRLKRINETINEIDNSVKSIKRITNYGDTYYFNPGEFNEPSGDEDDDEPLVYQDGRPLPDWLYTGIPPTLKDILDFLGDIIGGAISIKSWPAFAKLLGRLIPIFFRYGGLIPLLNLVATLWRGLGDRMDNAADRVLEKETLDRLKDLEAKADQSYKLLNEIAVSGSSGGDVSILLDRLQDILDKMQLYYNDVISRFDAQDEQSTRRYAELLGLVQSIRDEHVILDSNVACLEMWLKGNRSCDEFSTDVVSMLEAAADCCQYVRCHLDEYYHSLDDKIDDLTRSIASSFEQCHDELESLKRSLTGPDNPLDRIDDGIERGNVVGTGSLVLNFSHDLHVIKTRLTEIRRLL